MATATSERWIGTVEAARILGVTRRAINYWIREGKMLDAKKSYPPDGKRFFWLVWLPDVLDQVDLLHKKRMSEGFWDFKEAYASTDPSGSRDRVPGASSEVCEGKAGGYVPWEELQKVLSGLREPAPEPACTSCELLAEELAEAKAEIYRLKVVLTRYKIRHGRLSDFFHSWTMEGF